MRRLRRCRATGTHRARHQVRLLLAWVPLRPVPRCLSGLLSGYPIIDPRVPGPGLDESSTPATGPVGGVGDRTSTISTPDGAAYEGDDAAAALVTAKATCDHPAGQRSPCPPRTDTAALMVTFGAAARLTVRATDPGDRCDADPMSKNGAYQTTEPPFAGG